MFNSVMGCISTLHNGLQMILVCIESTKFLFIFVTQIMFDPGDTRNLHALDSSTYWPEEEFNKGVLVSSCAFSFSLENSFLCYHAIISFYTSQVSPTCTEGAWCPTKIFWWAPLMLYNNSFQNLSNPQHSRLRIT